MLSVSLKCVSVKIFSVFGQFRESMRARVRMDDGEHYEWHDITQGLWQGCELVKFNDDR